MASDVIVIIGAGGIGMAVARRQGFGKIVLLADFNDKLLAIAAEDLRNSSYNVDTQIVDVSSRSSVQALAKAIGRRVGTGRHVLLADRSRGNAEAAAEVLADAGFVTSTAEVDVSSRADVERLVAQATGLGAVTGLVHAAGVSPSQAPIETILKVDLYGTALVLDLFGEVIAPGGSGVVIASQSGHRLPGLPAERNKALAMTPVEDLLALSFLAPGEVKETLHAYQLSNRGNVLRVAAEAVRWGKRGARSMRSVLVSS